MRKPLRSVCLLKTDLRALIFSVRFSLLALPREDPPQSLLCMPTVQGTGDCSCQRLSGLPPLQVSSVLWQKHDVLCFIMKFHSFHRNTDNTRQNIYTPFNSCQCTSHSEDPPYKKTSKIDLTRKPKYANIQNLHSTTAYRWRTYARR